MDVTMLSDVELRENLKKYGMSVGPIVASTRKLYEKKLSSFINGDEPTKKSPKKSPSRSPAQAATNGARGKSPVYQTPSPTPRSPPPASPEEVTQSDSDDCEESMRYLTEEEMAADRAALLAARRNKSNGVCGRALSTSIIFILLAVFAYFLIENAEQLKKLAESSAATSDDTV